MMKKKDLMKKGMVCVACWLTAAGTVWAQNVNIRNENDVNKMARTSFANFTANLLRDFGSGTNAYKGYREVDSENYRYYWEQNLCMMATEDGAEYMLEPRCIALTDSLCAGFKKHYNGLGLGWNEYIDDMIWNGLSFVRGARITGKAEYLNDAKTIFDTLWERGNHGPGDMWVNKTDDGSEGLWWRVKPDVHAEVGTWSDVLKSPLSNSGAVALACYLYELTGNADYYLPKAEKLWQWEVDVLWKEGEGIMEGWYPEYHGIYNGTQRDQEVHFGSRRTLHDLSTFFEATNALWRTTGKQIYWDWCLKCLDNILTKRLDGYGVIQNAFGAKDGSWCYEAARALTMFCYDNNLWDVTRETEGFKNLPSGLTFYQWMCNSAKEIRNDNNHMIILPTRKPGYALEAEDAKLEGGGSKTITVTEGLQYSRGKKVGNLGNGNMAHFLYNAAKAGSYTVDFYYTTATSKRTPVVVNGGTPMIKVFRANTINSRPEVFTETFNLRAGCNVITIGAGSAPDLDLVAITEKETGSSTPVTVTDSTRIEAEAANKLYGTRRNGNPTYDAGSAYSGYAMVQNLGKGNYAEFSFNVEEDGEYTLFVGYRCEEDLQIMPLVNKVDIDPIFCPATGGAVKESAQLVTLTSGSNSLRLANADAAMPDVDYILFMKGNVADGIKSLNAQHNTQPQTDVIYDMSGRKVAEGQKGIQIANGRKVLIK